MNLKENQNMDDLFRRAFDNHEVSPPSSLWDKIANEIPDSQADEIFKKALSDYEVEPSPQVWNYISRRLPINLRVRRHLTMLSRVAAVLLVGMFGMYLIDNWYAKQDTAVVHTPTEQITTPTEASNASTNSSVATTDDIQETTPTVIEEPKPDVPLRVRVAPAKPVLPSIFTRKPTPEKTVETNTQSQPIADATDLITRDPMLEDLLRNTSNNTRSEDVVVKPADIRKVESNPTNITPLALPIQRTSYLATAFAGKTSMPDLSSAAKSTMTLDKSTFLHKHVVNDKAFYLGVKVDGYNSNILNNALKEEFATLPNVEASYVTTLKSSYGFVIGRKMNKYWSFETGFTYANVGQRYREVANSVITTNADLQYARLPITVKYNTYVLTAEKPRVLSFVGGIHLSHLANEPLITVNTDGQDSPIQIDNAPFVQNEIGVHTGIDYDFFLNRNLSMSLGARIGLGTEITKFDTYNTQFGVHAGINYRFVGE